MIEIPSFLIFIFCLAGCGLHAFHLGKQVGVENTIEYLHDKGIVEFEDYEEK